MAAKHPAVNEAIREGLRRSGEADQSVIAARLGVSPSAVYRWIAGETSPKRAQWPDIEAVLGLKEGTLDQVSGQVPLAALLHRMEKVSAELVDIRSRLERLEAAASNPGRPGRAGTVTEISGRRAADTGNPKPTVRNRGVRPSPDVESD